MDGWIDGWMDGWMDGRERRWVDDGSGGCGDVGMEGVM